MLYNQDSEPLIVIDCAGGKLDPNAEWSFSCPVEPAVYESASDIQYYLLSIATNSLENNYADNSLTIYSEPVQTSGITLDKHTLELTEKTSGVLNATVMPEDASFPTVRYASGDNSVAVVDSNGNVYAMNAGTTVITVYTADGNFSDQCSVTVKKAKETLYVLSDRGLDLMVGEKTQLSLEDSDKNPVENAVYRSKISLENCLILRYLPMPHPIKK